MRRIILPSKWNLLTKFSVLSLLLCSIIAAYLARGIQKRLESDKLQQEAENTADVMASILSPQMTIEDFNTPLRGDRYYQIDSFIQDNVITEHIVQVKIWNDKGIVIYSDNQELVGQQYPLGEHLQKALEGRISMEISSLEDDENRIIREQHEKLIEIYIPVSLTSPSDVIGAFEVYHEYSDLEARITGMSNFVWGSVLIGFTLLYLLLFSMVRNASRELVDRKIAEVALQQSEKRFRSIFEGVDDAIFVESMQGEILDVNDRACEMFGWTHEEFITKTVSDLVPEAQIAVIPEEMPEEDIPEAPIETVNIRANGEEFPVEITARIQTLGDEEVMLVVVRDITERKEAEEVLKGYRSELELSNESLEQFAYVASHDLQEPLRMVSSFMELLSDQYGDQLDENAQEYIDFAVDGAQRMQRLVIDLLTYSRVGTRGKPFESMQCDEVLETSLDNLKVAIGEGNAVVTHDPLPVVMADEGQLVQLFQNLIGNAIKFIEDGPPKVHIGVSEEKGFHRFSIQDNGIGIAPENLERIFGVSQRLHSIDEFPGTGLGLAICKKIVGRHGGRIWVESEPGKGSTFFFTLPARD